jgi:hypothetical protein
LVRTLAAVTATVAAAAALSRAPSRHPMQLPPGMVEVHSEILVDGGTDVFGRGTVLHAANDFSGRAVIVVRGSDVRLSGFTIDGNRAALEVRADLPPSDVPFVRYTRNNGIFADGVSRLQIDQVRFREISGFAVLVSRSRDVTVDGVQIENSGSRNAAGANNTTGGILFEEGTANFRATECAIRKVRGNGIWTHSLYTSPRNGPGSIAMNRFDQVGRDAIQVGHATNVRVEFNTGRLIGYPQQEYDRANLALPVAIDTAGNVDRSWYVSNRFRKMSGKCIDLDGFHDGEVRSNVCENVDNFAIVMNNSNPDMQSRNIVLEDNEVDVAWYGGVFVIGRGHRIARNRLLRLNSLPCSDCSDRLLRAGIYLGAGAARPDAARDNVIEQNTITGDLMNVNCIVAAPGISNGLNHIRNNRCTVP